MQISFHMVGTHALAARLTAATVTAQLQAARHVETTVLDITNTAKQLAPVRTGTLRRSVTHHIDGDGLGARFGTNLEYAPYVEFGTSRMAPRAFLGPALDIHTPAFVDGLKAIAARF